jgi:hypothetical protein
VERKALEDKNLDLKAVNPNRKVAEDTRMPEELIALIEDKQKEITVSLAELKNTPPAQSREG